MQCVFAGMMYKIGKINGKGKRAGGAATYLSPTNGSSADMLKCMPKRFFHGSSCISCRCRKDRGRCGQLSGRPDLEVESLAEF